MRTTFLAGRLWILGEAGGSWQAARSDRSGVDVVMMLLQLLWCSWKWPKASGSSQ